MSTDYNTADQLYFEPLALEDVLNVIEKEQVDGVMVQFGGQTAVNLAGPLEKMGVTIYGTSVSSIDLVEDRDLFYQLLRKLDIPHIPGISVNSQKMAVEAADQLGYPVLIRPSYVIGGQGMLVLQNQQELETYLRETTFSFPLLVDQYVSGMEVEVDAVCDGDQVFIPGIFEHVERAGVHSGDSMAIFPAPSLDNKQRTSITEYTHKIAKELGAKGLINIQFVITGNTIYVLEVNPKVFKNSTHC